MSFAFFALRFARRANVIFKLVVKIFLGTEGKQETVFLFELFRAFVYCEFEFLVFDDDLVFLCPTSDLGDDAEGVEHVYEKDTEDDSRKESGVFNVRTEPFDRDDNPVVDKQVVNRADDSPKKGKERADDALKIPGAFGIVPQFDVHSLDEDQARDIFDERHEEGDERDHEHPLPNGR